MGQVWSKADFDGTNEASHLGGRGSILAVTVQNPGPDGIRQTADDLRTPLNESPVQVSVDATPGAETQDPLDRIRGFFSEHDGGSNFVMVDGSTHFVTETANFELYRGLSTRSGGEVANVNSL